MAGKQLTDLVTAMANGKTYINIHTEQTPNGEIRGQIQVRCRAFVCHSNYYLYFGAVSNISQRD
jgi:hypothetical protein